MEPCSAGRKGPAQWDGGRPLLIPRRAGDPRRALSAPQSYQQQPTAQHGRPVVHDLPAIRVVADRHRRRQPAASCRRFFITGRGQGGERASRALPGWSFRQRNYGRHPHALNRHAVVVE